MPLKIRLEDQGGFFLYLVVQSSATIHDAANFHNIPNYHIENGIVFYDKYNKMQEEFCRTIFLKTSKLRYYWLRGKQHFINRNICAILYYEFI